MSSSARTKIRCPNCQNAGKIRAELLNRRVSCKHCKHVFRAEPVVDPAAARTAPTSPAATARPSGDRMVALELEVRRLREDLTTGRDLAGQVHLLRDRLARSAAELGEARQALEALQLERDEAVAHRDRLLRELGASRSLEEAPMPPDDRTRVGPAPEVTAVDADAPTEADSPPIKPGAGPLASEPSTAFDSRLDDFEGTEWPAAAGSGPTPGPGREVMVDE